MKAYVLIGITLFLLIYLTQCNEKKPAQQPAKNQSIPVAPTEPDPGPPAPEATVPQPVNYPELPFPTAAPQDRPLSQKGVSLLLAQCPPPTPAVPTDLRHGAGLKDVLFHLGIDRGSFPT